MDSRIYRERQVKKLRHLTGSSNTGISPWVRFVAELSRPQAVAGLLVPPLGSHSEESGGRIWKEEVKVLGAHSPTAVSD